MLGENLKKLRKQKGLSQEELAAKVQKERVYIQSEKVRGVILFLSFIALMSAGLLKNQYISISMTGICILAALMVLYRNIGIMTKVTTNDLKLGVLKITTIFNLGIMLACVVFGLSVKAGLIHLSGKSEEIVTVAVISVIILFTGLISLK